MNYIVLDLEFNQYFDFKDPRIVDDPACSFEIIQIGAVKLDEGLNETGRKSFFVKPQIYKRMHPYVNKITGITTKDLAHERHFDEVYDEFISFAAGEKSVLCIWGTSDINLLYKNILYYRLNSRRLTKKYVNVQQLASEYFKQPSNESIGLRAAVERLELPTGESFHNALHDAAYTAEVFRVVKPDELIVHSFNLQKLRQAEFAKANSINSGLLFASCERELNRKLTEREKDLILRVYFSGQNKTYDLLKPKKPVLTDE